MSLVLGQRAAALAAAALLAGVFAVALAEAGRDGDQAGLPRPAVEAVEDWSVALAGVAAQVSRSGRPGDCGWLVLRSTQGVLHPVLPCGARIYLEHGGRRVLTRVVAQSPVRNGRQLDLTPRLARRLGLDGVRQVRWTFSR